MPAALLSEKLTRGRRRDRHGAMTRVGRMFRR
jgi:hypothetical protein